MRYKVFCNGELVNTIIADEEFVAALCAAEGLTYEPDPLPEPEPEPGGDGSVWDEMAAAIREGVNDVE